MTPTVAPKDLLASESAYEGSGHSVLRKVTVTEMPTSRLRGEVRGKAKRMNPPPFCTVSCLQINEVIQFPGHVTFSLGINCDHPNKYREITLKTYIYEAHPFKTFFFPTLKNTRVLPRVGKKEKTPQFRTSCVYIPPCQPQTSVL